MMGGSCSVGWGGGSAALSRVTVSTPCPFRPARVPSEQGGVSSAPAQPGVGRRGARVCSGEEAARPLRGSPSPSRSPGWGHIGEVGGRLRPLPCAGPHSLPCRLSPQGPVQRGLLQGPACFKKRQVRSGPLAGRAEAARGLQGCLHWFSAPRHPPPPRADALGVPVSLGAGCSPSEAGPCPPGSMWHICLA